MGKSRDRIDQGRGGRVFIAPPCFLFRDSQVGEIFPDFGVERFHEFRSDGTNGAVSDRPAIDFSNRKDRPACTRKEGFVDAVQLKNGDRPEPDRDVSRGGKVEDEFSGRPG